MSRSLLWHILQVPVSEERTFHKISTFFHFLMVLEKYLYLHCWGKIAKFGDFELSTLMRATRIAGWFVAWCQYLSAVSCMLSTCTEGEWERESERHDDSGWRESSFCFFFLHHFDTLTGGEVKHGKSLVPSFSSSCCWQLLNASLVFNSPKLQPWSWCHFGASVL